MCGICGIVDSKNNISRHDLEEMLQIMNHRGPDDRGLFIEGNAGLGNVRLSIIDLSEMGHQPMRNDDGSLWIVFNGEIYNYIELRQVLEKEGYNFRSDCDTEVLLKAYEFWGNDCLSKLNGMFAFIIYDRKKNKLFGARDRFGIKPFYYYSEPGRFIFSSEIKPILVCGILPEPDFEVIYNFLVFSLITPPEKTFFEGIKKLLPGYSIEVDLENANYRTSQWWELKIDIRDTTTDVAKTEFRRLFDESIRLRLRSDVPVGLCLSGGLDSSGIASVISNKGGNNGGIKAFSSVYSIDFPGNEKKYIDAVVKKLNITGFETEPSSHNLIKELKKLIYYQEEPFYSLSPYAQWEVMKLAKKSGMKVLLCGQGSDEALAGYSGYMGFYLADMVKHGRLSKLRKNMKAYSRLHGKNYPYMDILYPMVPGFLKIRSKKKKVFYLNGFHFNGHKSNGFYSYLISSRPLSQVLKDSINYQIPGLLRFEDKTSMAHSIECRVPFLDHQLVEYLFTLPDNMKLRDGKTKYIFRESLNGNLPDIIYNRHDKVGFASPDEIWLKEKAVWNYVEEILLSERALCRGIVTEDGIKKLLRNFRAGKLSESKHIWKLVILELWFRLYIDGDYKKEKKILEGSTFQ